MEIKCNSIYYSDYENTLFEKLLLEDISLEIKQGKINGIIGQNGSGKTAFLNLINGLLTPTFGDIQIGEHHIKNRKEPLSGFGYVFSNPKQQFFLSTVKEEIEFGLKQCNYPLENIESRVNDALKMVGLNDSYLNQDPGQLSYGEMRKLAIASVLVFNPKILVLDNPTVGLDKISEKSFLKMLKMLKNKYHKTIIIVSQDMNMIHKIVDYLFVFYNGKKVLEGTKYEVFSCDQLEQYHIKKPDLVEFSYQVLKQKGIKLGYRDDVNDLIKDIYRHAA